MSLLTPFFESPPPSRSNLSKMITSVVSTLSDEQVLAWAASMDWSEPVLTVRRFGRQAIGGWIEAELKHASLAEVLVSSGDDRLVRLLLDPSRFPEAIRWNGVQLKESEYHHIDIGMRLANAAIGTGKQSVLEHVLGVVLGKSVLAHQWLDGSRFSPAVCLASHRDMAPETAMKMAATIEKSLVAHVEAQWGKPTSKHFRQQWRSALLSHSCRLGNLSLTSAMIQKHGLSLTFSQWDDLLDSGHIQWCTDWVTENARWSRPIEEKGRGWAPREEPENPALVLLPAAIKQFTSAAETFKGKRLRQVQDKALANLDYVLHAVTIDGPAAGLLKGARETFSSRLAPDLIAHDPRKALTWLNVHGGPLSMEEALAWIASGSASEVLEQRAVKGCVSLSPQGASECVERHLHKHPDTPAKALSWLARNWKMETFVKDWPLASKEKAEVMAELLAFETPGSNATRVVRRM